MFPVCIDERPQIELREVVGVVSNVKLDGLDQTRPSTALYVPLSQLSSSAKSDWGSFPMTIVVRSTVSPANMVSAVTGAIHDVGIRLALGASLADVLRLVVFEGMKPALIGVVIGIAAALGMGRVVASMMFQVKPSDPLTFISVAALLGFIALIACLIPAYRASRVDPIIALRNE